MKTKLEALLKRKQDQEGKVGWIVLWLLGVPTSVLFCLFILRGCT